MSNDLLPGENIVMRVHQHWVVLLRPLLLPILLIVLVVAADLIPINAPNVDTVKTIATLVVVALFGIVAIVAWLGWNSRRFTVTDRRVVLDTGFFSRNSKVISLDRVQDIATNQGLLGRIFGYGRVEIDSAGAAGAEVLSAIPRPQRFRDAVFAHSENMRTQSASPPPDPGV